MGKKKVSAARSIRRQSEQIFMRYGFGLDVERDPETKQVVGLRVENERLDEDNLTPQEKKKLEGMGWKYREVGIWFIKFYEEKR